MTFTQQIHKGSYQMRIRECRPEDIWAIAEIEALCNLTDPLALYYRRIPSHDNDRIVQDERFWKAYVSSCRRFQELKRLQPGTVCYVLEETTEASSPHTEQQGGRKGHDDNDGSVIVGFAIWTRAGKSEVARRWQKRGRQWLTRLRAAIYYIGIALYYPFDPTINYGHISQVYPIVSQPPQDITLAPERWEIDAMYIHPRYQRRGYGTQALQWALDQATRERVPVLVKSSSQGYRLYHHAGFRSINKLDFGGLFNPGEPGMHMMVWEPE